MHKNFNVILLLFCFLQFSCKKDLPPSEDCSGSSEYICTESHYQDDECIGYIRYFYSNGPTISGKKIVSLQNDIVRNITYHYDSENRLQAITNSRENGNEDEVKYSYITDTSAIVDFYYSGILHFYYKDTYNKKKKLVRRERYSASGMFDTTYTYMYYSDDKIWKIKKFGKDGKTTYTTFEYYSNLERIQQLDEQFELLEEELIMKNTDGFVEEYRKTNAQGKLIQKELYSFNENGKPIRCNVYNKYEELEKHIVYHY